MKEIRKVHYVKGVFVCPKCRQSYVQDCPVCCQPWQVELTRDAHGDWSATLRTSDE